MPQGLSGYTDRSGHLNDAQTLPCWSGLKHTRGYDARVLDVIGYSGAGGQQVRMALAEIRADDDVFALYGFSAGGYAIYNIIRALTRKEKDRLALVVVLGAPPPPEKQGYGGPWELIFRLDPPAGHMAGPRALLARPYGPD